MTPEGAIGREIRRIQEELQYKQQRQLAEKMGSESERSRLMEAIQARSNFLRKEALAFVSPYTATLHRSGALEVLTELRREMGIGNEIKIGCCLQYHDEYHDKFYCSYPYDVLLKFKGDPLECEDWRGLGTTLNLERANPLIDDLKSKLKALNSIETTSKNGFSSSGCYASLFWYHKPQHAIDIQFIIAKPSDHSIELGGSSVFDRPMTKYSPETWVPGGVGSIYRTMENLSKSSFVYPESQWKNRNLLRRKVAEAYLQCVR